LILGNKADCRLLGLDGEWGSGKSNLIKILESKLEETHHVFIYDAWGHQEDLQRRAFLEELTAKLCAEGVISPKTWKSKLKDLLSRKRETVTRTVPRLSYGIVITALVAIFTPVAKVISDSIDNNAISIAVTTLPIAVGLLIWIGASIRRERILGIQDVYAIYKEKDVTNETHVQISEKEPSVVEFQTWMFDLAEALDNKKLVIVFDNMDRLPPNKVREFWSLIHTFFSEASYKGIWVIIPFDRAHIAAAFRDDTKISEQFLSKSFAVTFRVAPPVLTDWQHFFALKYREAFDDSEDHELPTVRQIFDALNEKISPRSIIHFINDLVAHRLVVEDHIPLRYIAAFVLRKSEILADTVNQILTLEFLGNVEPIFRDDKELANYIAALAYHVPVESASQVSLQREIHNAMRDKNYRRFNKLADHYHFITILENVISVDEIEVDSAAETLSRLDKKVIEREDNQQRISKLWDELCVKELRNPRRQQEVHETHKLLFSHCSETHCRKLLTHLLQVLRSAEGFDGAAYGSAMLELSQILEDAPWAEDELQNLVQEIEKDPEIFVEYVSVTKQFYHEFKLKCDETELVEYVIGLIPNTLEDVSCLAYVTDEYDLGSVVEEMAKAVTLTSITVENMVTFFDAYKALAPEKPIAPLADAQINTLFSQATPDTAEELELAAMRLARGSQFPNYGGRTQTIVEETNESLAASIAERVEFYTNYGDLLLDFINWRPALLKSVLRKLTLQSYGISRLAITKVLPHFKELCDTLEIPPQDFMGRLSGWWPLARDSITAENVTSMVRDVELVSISSQSSDKLSKHLIETLIEHLEALGEDEWITPLRDEESFLFRVIYHLLNSGRLKSPPDNAITVYKKILLEVARSEFAPRHLNRWVLFYERTHKSKLKATAKNIRDALVTDTDITLDAFVFLKELLLNDADLKGKAADVTRRILAPVIHDDRCLDFIVQNEKAFVPIIRKAADDAADLKDEVRRKTQDQNVSVSLIRFAEKIGLQDLPEASAGETESEAE
jgi:hypothetical protein